MNNDIAFKADYMCTLGQAVHLAEGCILHRFSIWSQINVDQMDVCDFCHSMPIRVRAFPDKSVVIRSATSSGDGTLASK